MYYLGGIRHCFNEGKKDGTKRIRVLLRSQFDAVSLAGVSRRIMLKTWMQQSCSSAVCFQSQQLLLFLPLLWPIGSWKSWCGLTSSTETGFHAVHICLWSHHWLSRTSCPHLPLPWFPHLFYSFVMYRLFKVAWNPLWIEVRVNIGKERKWIMEFSSHLTVLCNKILGVRPWQGTSPSKVVCILYSLDTHSYFWTLKSGHVFWGRVWQWQQDRSFLRGMLKKGWVVIISTG